MQPVQAQDYKIVFNQEGYTQLNALLAEKNYSILFILVDENTHENCLAAFLANVETNTTIEIIEVDAGEEFKNLETCDGVWNALSELNADRKSAMINLGGGVVTDMGGFIACTFKRGIDYINIPSTLLSMVDASVGGKTGVDLGALKNQIGVISNPQMVLVDIKLLQTLPQKELRSGYAEMLKHGLISSQAYWEAVKKESFTNIEGLAELIQQSITIKNEVVTEDPFENGLRKTLNFGHTLGHAIESYFLAHPEKERLLHGEAIAIGMVLAAYLSVELTGLSKEAYEDIASTMVNIYGKSTFSESDINNIIDLLKYDKKNAHGNILFVLLQEIGKPVIDQKVDNALIHLAFKDYENFKAKS